MTLDKETKLHGIRAKQSDYLEQLNKAEKKKQRTDTLYTAYGLYGDCLEFPEKTKISDVDKFIIASKGDLEEKDLKELRDLRTFVQNDIDVAVLNVFPGSKRIEMSEKEWMEMQEAGEKEATLVSWDDKKKQPKEHKVIINTKTGKVKEKNDGKDKDR